jgi:hypothetical protein
VLLPAGIEGLYVPVSYFSIAGRRDMRDKICFSYLPDAPLGIRHRGAAQRALRDYQRDPDGSPTGCFSYTPDVPLRIGNPDPRNMPSGNPSNCFSSQE